MRKFPRSDKQVSAAKQAQALRLGQAGAFGKRKRCVRGKSCGASCISNYKVCMVDLTWVGKNALGSMRDRLMERKKPEAIEPGPPSVTLKKGPPPLMPIFDVATSKALPSKFKFGERKNGQSTR
jgi:hypothetical protein